MDYGSLEITKQLSDGYGKTGPPPRDPAYMLRCYLLLILTNPTMGKQKRRKAYLAADADDPTELVVVIAEAEKAETDEEKKAEIAQMRHFILNNMNAFRDYRDILKSEKGVNTKGIRPMGAADPI